jgi:hypothetical protein
VLPAVVSVGTVSSWAALIVLGGVAWVVYRGGGGTALDVLRNANAILEKRVHDLEQERKEDAKTIAMLKARTDVAEALAPLMTWAHAHEANAATRNEQQLSVLELIAARLGPDGD